MTHGEQGALILKAFGHFKARPGTLMRLPQINSYMTGNHLHATDINAGIAYCLAHKWIEAVPSAAYRLTPVGYAKI